MNENNLKTIPSKEVILTLFHKWINQRAGLEFRNYGDVSSYRSESRRITNQRKDALTLLRAVELSNGITAEDLVKAFRAFSGRLEIKQNEKGYYFDYCTGQYFPTEYRAAACAVLSSALWDYHSPDYKDGNEIRNMFKRMFGRGLASRWLD